MKRRALLRSSLAMASGASLPWLVRAGETLWDYVIVGAGTAGLPAAIFASRRGARVLLVDAADDIGGTLHMANGQISGAGTTLQASLGIQDSPDQHFEDVMRMTRNLADPDIVRTTVDHAARTVDWLLAGGLQPLPGHPITADRPGRPGYSVRRYLWDKSEGRAILKVVRNELRPEVGSGRVVLQLNTRVSGLLTSDAGSVEGIRAEGPLGPFVARGRHVLLTSGGYAMNPDLFEMLVGHPAYAGSSYPHSQGDGLRLAVSVGGWLRGQHLHRAGTGNILSAEGFKAKRYARFNTSPQDRAPWEIWVNLDGRRFIREDEPVIYERSMALLKQPRLRYTIVFDHEIFQNAPVGIQGWTREKMVEHFDNHPLFAKADDLETLAKMTRVDPKGLMETVAQYNEAVRLGRDTLGRSHLPTAIKKPPFYGITHLGTSATSSTGVAVDAKLRVLRGDGNFIPNLYAAGEVLGAGATLGNAFAPGMMLTPALTLGRILGETLPVNT